MNYISKIKNLTINNIHMKIVLLLLGVLISPLMNAQSQYETGMEKAFELWKANKVEEASNLFERIARVETNNWLPKYYIANVNILAGFKVKDEGILKLRLDKAQKYLDEAKLLSPKNPEILVMQALLNTVYIAFDGSKYVMTLAPKNTAIYEEALLLAPNNPRVVLSKAEWGMGSAKFFGQPTAPYCKDIERALRLFEKEEIKEQFQPSWGKSHAEEVLQQCK